VVKLTDYFFSTYKEEPGNADIPGYALSIRAGLIKKTAAGIYTFMPLGLKVLGKIEKIIREEMDSTGALEILMPALQPADLWIQSGRWQQYGPELFRLKDRNDRQFCLGPTHEEIITNIAHQNIKSYKDMPLNLYQIQVKFRDEIRPRYGILRAREFIMKDAYSFTANEKDLDSIYESMYKCYSNIIERLGLKYFAVEADTGLIGGKYSHEFIILAKNGEDEIVYCPGCSYSANYEMADFRSKEDVSLTEEKDTPDYSEVSTPGITDIKSLSTFLSLPEERIIKTLFLKDCEKNIYAFLVSGHRELNIAKVQKFLGKNLEMADDEVSNLNIGYAGPAGLDSRILIYADNDLKHKSGMAAGANRPGFHLINIDCTRDFKPHAWGDFVYPQKGDICPNCEHELIFEKGIEIGHIFKLGTKYSEKMNAMFLDSDGKLKPVIMGCYGIGVSRILAAVIEQLNDSRGIVWPLSIAPFLVNIIAINIEDDDVKSASDMIYDKLLKSGIEVMYDNRNVRAGVKFKDSDLIGIPIKLIVGKNFPENKTVELELRKDGYKKTLDLDSAIRFIAEYPSGSHF